MIDWVLAYWTEILGFATGLACVALAARRNVWTFPIGIANNIVFVVLFGATGLYALAGLQLVYLGFAIHGWLHWARGVEQDRLYVARTPRRAWPWVVVAGVAGAALLWWLLSTFTDSTLPLADAATTSGSLVAQYLLNRKRLENWYVWIGVDVASVILFLATGLAITAALYVVFIGLCVYGLLSWRRIERGAVEVPESAAVARG
ncbi:nicotinamide mononucleotide transporter [Microbacterium sp. AG1240]|uniref:nicotinamide riboside transporter PnuC n=1 Tax=Microbacterium sp. AG1240 TaxID=2183992 RepID=UPI000EB279BC|nr:nicotinamide riboside transporter PnuC [Microbacterium sp. AG1240]RKT33282.1 nicotinamide mononucleotide transporter [Microbacterium sp. AG1240]